MAYVGAVAPVTMYWLEGERWLLGCVLFLVANLAFGNSMLLFNAFLPEISGAAERDAVSSKGWALGYAGGGILITLNVMLFSRADAGGLRAAHSGGTGGALKWGKGDDVMQRIWNDIKNHPLTLALFMVWWVTLALLNFVVPRHTQDSVARLYYVPPAIAGALVCWWRRTRADRITVGTMSGATVLVLQFALMLPRELTEAVHGGKGLLGVLRVLVDVETLAFGALACVVGAVLGFLAALAVVVFAYLEKRWTPAVSDSQSESHSPRSVAAEPVDRAPTISGGRIMPRPKLAIAGVLVLLATAILAPGVYGRSVSPPPPFITLNVLVAIALLAPVSRWSDDAGTALVLIAAIVSFSLGAAVLVAVGFKWAEWPVMPSVAMSAGALAELGAGVLALATFRKSDVHYAA